jgi:hypothetical protein
MRTAALRLCLSGFIVSAIPTLTQAAIEYSIKKDGTEMFRTQAMEPPPVAILQKGENLELLERGKTQSRVRISEGWKGWVRNADIQGLASVAPQKFRMEDVTVVGEGNIFSPIILDLAPPSADIVSLERSFSGEILESMDKEQVEMRHDEN